MKKRFERNLRVMLPVFAMTLLILWTAVSSAQEPAPEPKLLISGFAGGVRGDDLWEVGNQPVLLINNQLTVVGVDTFALTRNTGRGITAGGTATLFVNQFVGLGGEVSYTGPAQKDRCEIVFADTPSPGSPEARGFNDQFCADIDRENNTFGAISLLLDITLRPLPTAAVRPYLRVGGGITDLGRSSAAVAGQAPASDLNGDGFLDNVDRPIIIDDETSTAGLTANYGFGLMIPAKNGYFFRIEIRDQIYNRAVVRSAANVLGEAEISKDWTHTPSLIVGVGITMQQRRGRTSRRN